MESTPMVNGRFFKQFQGQRVTFLCQVLQEESPNAIMVKLSDGSMITVHVPSGSEIVTPFIDVMGKIVNENSVEAMRIQSAGSNADLESYNKIVELSNGTYRKLFA